MVQWTVPPFYNKHACSSSVKSMYRAIASDLPSPPPPLPRKGCGRGVFCKLRYLGQTGMAVPNKTTGHIEGGHINRQLSIINRTLLGGHWCIGFVEYPLKRKTTRYGTPSEALFIRRLYPKFVSLCTNHCVRCSVIFGHAWR